MEVRACPRPAAGQPRSRRSPPRWVSRLGRLLRVLSQPAHVWTICRDALRVGRRIHADSDHLRETLAWLCRGQDVTGCGGVSAGYYFAHGWLPPYPETTGYIISTFLQYASVRGDRRYVDRAVRMGDWEIEIQLPSGGVRGGIGINAEPIVFNTGQAILGWIRLFQEVRAERFLDAARAAANWLLSVQHNDGSWRRCTHKNVPHAYHSRVAWALLEAHDVTRTPAYRSAAQANLRWVLGQANPDAWLQNAGFEPGQRPFTHTIAYTLRGLLEASAYFTGTLHERMRDLVQAAAETMMMRYERSKRTPLGLPRFLPATFDEDWVSAGISSCLTGNAQMAIVWMKLYRLTGDGRFLNAALKIVDQVKATQSLRSRHPGIRGGVAGAYPIWGSYERLGYPNWAAKFLADAILLQESIMREIGDDPS